jgi:hypothetical protein
VSPEEEAHLAMPQSMIGRVQAGALGLNP